jgi:hypothetical protein
MNTIIPSPFDERAEVTAKSDELIAEFRAHQKEFIAANPTLTDENKIFRGWAIQKIAGLQCVVLNLVERVIELEQSKRR